jgi:DNA polymerase-4
LADLRTFYRTLTDLTDLTGISTGLSRQLHRRSIHTPLHFYEASQDDLRRHFGMIGLKWYFRLRGWEVDNVDYKERQIGHQHVLAPEYRTTERAYAVLIKLAHKAGKRLRAEGFFARGLYVGVRLLEGGYWEHHRRRELFQDQITIARLTQQIFSRFKSRETPLMVRVVLFGLERSSAQPISLFDDLEKQRRLSETLDKINDDFGPMTIHPASSLDTATAAPDRIPFGRVRYEIGEYEKSRGVRYNRLGGHSHLTNYAIFVKSH